MAAIEPVAEPSIREALQSSMETVAEPIVATPDAPAQPAAPADSRARAADGKFTKADPAAPAAPVAAPQAVQPAVSDTAVQPAVAAPVTLDPLADAPQAWKKEMRPEWATLKPEVRAYLHEREKQFQQGVGTYRQIANEAKPLMDAVQPFMADIQGYGRPAPEVIQQLLGAQRTLSHGTNAEKLQLFQRLSQDFGVPIAALHDQASQQQYLAQQQQRQQPAQPAFDPNRIKEQIKLEMQIETEIRQIESNTKDYPFFQYVRNDMGKLMESDPALSIHDAYQQAVEAPQHATLVQALQTQQAAEAERQRAAAAAAHVQVARANAVSPKSATPAAPATVNGKASTVREALKEAMGIHAGGARI